MRGNGNRTVNIHDVRTRYLLLLSVRILIGRMAFPLPPNTLLRWDDDLLVRLDIVLSTSRATVNYVFLVALGSTA